MLDNASSNKEKLFILDELIKRFKASVVRQSMFAEFEKNIHEYDQEGKVLTKEVFNDLYYQLNKKYYGNDVILDDEIKYEWSRIPHFYYDFYVYQYATGYISALKIASDIYNHTPNALNNYLKFLKLGNTKDPVTSLSIAGVDLTNPNTFDMAFKEFNTTMNKFENIYKGSEINGK
jgi:oligoendopeptidase F